MENIGALAVLLALAFAVYAVLGSLIGKWANRPFLAVSGERSVYTVFGLLTVAWTAAAYRERRLGSSLRSPLVFLAGILAVLVPDHQLATGAALLLGCLGVLLANVATTARRR